jgi:hypothetical protein
MGAATQAQPTQGLPGAASSTATQTPAGTNAMGATATDRSASGATGAASAAASGTPTSATVGVEPKVGAEIKDPSGVVVGTIAGTSAGADGSTNVVVTSGDKKFALPKASLSVGADGALATTATKAQIDATLAGAKPQ